MGNEPNAPDPERSDGLLAAAVQRAEERRRGGQAALLDDRTTESEALFMFELAGLRLAIPAAFVDSVGEAETPTPVPRCPPHLLGLVNQGQGVTALVDLATFLNLARPPDAEVDPMYRRTLLVSAGGFEAGILCDRAHGLLEVTKTQTRSPSVLQGTTLRSFLIGELDLPLGVVGVIDLAAVLDAAAVT